VSSIGTTKYRGLVVF